MTSGLKLSTAAIAMLTAVGLGAMPAAAADLGGNCCADLEERIAELEATTARKGNRKVKLEVSGHVNEALIFWDDGFESNSGVYTNDNSRSRFRFKGSAKITDDVKAGYLLEIGVRSANSKRFNQNDPQAAGESGLDVRHSTWYLDSKSLGQVWVGRTAPAAEGVTEINLSNSRDIAKFADIEDSALGLFARTSTGGVAGTSATQGLQIRRAIRDSGDQPGEPERGQIVKYVSPEFAGFIASAAWGGDDYWDIGLRYKGDFAGFQLAAGIAYGQESSENADAQIGNCNTSRANAGVDCEQVGGSLSIMHSDSGLYASFAAGWSQDNSATAAARFGGNGDNENTFWALDTGIERKFFPIGKTTLFGQYYDGDSGSTGRSLFINGVDTTGDIISSDITMYGGGIVQELSAASMLLYVYYRHVDYDFNIANPATGAAIAGPAFEELDMVVAGGMIKF